MWPVLEKGICSDCNHTTQWLSDCSVQKLGNDLWKDSESIATKVYGQTVAHERRCLKGMLRDLHWLSELRFAIQRFFEQSATEIIIYCVTAKAWLALCIVQFWSSGWFFLLYPADTVCSFYVDNEYSSLPTIDTITAAGSPAVTGFSPRIRRIFPSGKNPVDQAIRHNHRLWSKRFIWRFIWLLWFMHVSVSVTEANLKNASFHWGCNLATHDSVFVQMCLRKTHHFSGDEGRIQSVTDAKGEGLGAGPWRAPMMAKQFFVSPANSVLLQVLKTIWYRI